MDDLIASSYAEAEATKDELCQLCFGRVDLPVDLVMTFHRGVQRLWSVIEYQARVIQEQTD